MYITCVKKTQTLQKDSVYSSLKSPFEKTHHIPPWENSLRQCLLYPNLFTYLIQFHSIAQNSKGKSLQRGKGDCQE